MTGGSLLIYAPVALHRGADGGLWVEAQAVNGLRLWAAHFAQVVAMMPLVAAPAPPGWVPLAAAGAALDRVRLEPLPAAWRPDVFLRHWRGTARRIRALIAEADHLSFAIGGLWGDWGAVSAFEAAGMGRPFAVWTDRVESEVTRQAAATGRWRSRLRARLTHRPMAWLERAVIRRASLGLFHGKETFDAYAPFCPGPSEVVHDVHLGPADHIGPEALAAKAAGAAEGPLRLAYVGRMEAMKGPLDWVEVVGRLRARGVAVRALWLGDGSLRGAMEARVRALGLGGVVEMPGFAEDRAAVLAALRDAHGLLFCHNAPESPRCLLEALASGAPILGTRSAFPEDLIAGHGGGVLVERGDVAGLAEAVAGLAANRARLRDLIGRAARDGARFTDEAVFRHRGEVILRHLPAGERIGAARR